jgi:hypothetical protein
VYPTYPDLRPLANTIVFAGLCYSFRYDGSAPSSYIRPSFYSALTPPGMKSAYVGFDNKVKNLIVAIAGEAFFDGLLNLYQNTADA